MLTVHCVAGTVPGNMNEISDIVLDVRACSQFWEMTYPTHTMAYELIANEDKEKTNLRPFREN